MNKDKFRFLTVVAFALVLLFFVNAQALGPIAPLPALPELSIISINNRVNDLESQVETACCTNGWYVNSKTFPSEEIPAADSSSSYVDVHLLCPDRNSQFAILGGYQWGPSVGGTKPAIVASATVTNPPCGGAFYVRLSKEATAFFRNELYLWVVCVDWPFETDMNCPD